MVKLDKQSSYIMSKNHIKKRTPPPPISTSDSSWFSSLSFQITAIIIAAIVAYFYYNHSLNNTKFEVKNLYNADEKSLKNALNGDKPYLHYCSNDSQEINDKIYDLFKQVQKSSKLGNQLEFSSLNCNQILPSKKTIYDRFKLNKDSGDVIFGTAPWLNTPKLAPKQSIRDAKTLTTFIDKFLTPQVKKIASDRELNALCGFDKPSETDMSSIKNTCIVLVKGTRYTKILTDTIEKLIKHIPRIRIAMIDGTKRRLSYEDIDLIPSDSFGLRVYALRAGGHYLTMTNPLTYDYLTTFVSYAFSQPLSEYTDTAESPKNIKILRISTILKNKRDAKKAKDKKQASANKPTTTPTSSTKSKSTTMPKTTADSTVDTRSEEEKRAAVLARERRIREQMDRQAQQFHATEDADEEEEEGEGSDGGSDNDDEDVIEL